MNAQDTLRHIHALDRSLKKDDPWSWLTHARALERIARTNGDTEDADKFKEQADKLEAALRKKPRPMA